MADTVIDSLVIKLGLDPSAFKKAKAENKADLAAMRNDVAQTQTAIDAIQAKANRQIKQHAVEERQLAAQIATIKKNSTARTKAEDEKQVKSLQAQLQAKRTANAEERKQTTAQLVEQKKILDAKQRAIKDTEQGEKRQLDGARKRTQQTRDEGTAVSALTSKVIGLFAAFTAGEGLSSFLRSTITGLSDMGRAAENLGIPIEELGAFEGAVRRIGGTAEQAHASLQQMVHVREAIRAGQMPEGAQIFNSLEVTTQDLADPVTAMLKMADAAERFKKAGDLPGFEYRASKLGFDEHTIYTMEQGRAKLKELMEEARKSQGPLEGLSKKAQALQRAWVNLQDKSSALGRALIDRLAPGLEKIVNLLGRLADWADAHMGVVTAIVGTLAALAAISFVGFAAGLVSTGVAATAALGPIGLLVGALTALELKYRSVSKVGLAFERGALRIDRSYSETRADYYAGMLKRFPKNKNYQDQWKYWSNRVMDDNDAIVDVSKQIETLQKDVDANTKVTGWGAIPGTGPSDVSGVGKPPPASAQNLAKSAIGYLKAQGLSDVAARGTVAALYAESGLNPTARNPKSGAYGIGQWLGKRQAELFRQYGPTPTFVQQLQFMAQELKGGKQGGGAVLAASTADQALIAHITQVERPAKGYETNRDLAAGRALLAKLGGTSGPGAIPSPVFTPDPRDTDPNAPTDINALRSKFSRATNGKPTNIPALDPEEVAADRLKEKPTIVGSLGNAAQKLAQAAQALLASSVALRGNSPLVAAKSSQTSNLGVILPASYDRGLNVGASVSYAHHVISNDNSQNVQATTNIGAINMTPQKGDTPASMETAARRAFAYNAQSGLV